MIGYIKWVGGAVLFALIVIQYSTCNYYKHQSDEQSSLITASQDSIKYYKDRDGKNSAQIAVLEGSKDNLLNIIGKNDKAMTKLIKSGAKSGVVVNQVTRIDTLVLIKRDTVDGAITYKNTLYNNWYTLDQSIVNDSLSVSLEVRDSISVSFSKVRQGFLKPKKSVVIVTNANPYVKTSGLKAFDIPKNNNNKHKFWVGLGIGVGAGYLLFK